MIRSVLFGVLLASFLFFDGILADTPANCSYDHVIGDWQVSIGPYSKDCSTVKYRKAFNFSFRYPNLVYDTVGNMGTWTLIYDEGFEFVITNRKWLVMFDWDPLTNVSFCGTGKPAWSYDVLMRQYFCTKLKKVNPIEEKTPIFQLPASPVNNLNRKYVRNDDFVEKINKVQSSWTAVHYEDLESMTLLDIHRRHGGRKSVIHNRPKPAAITPELERLAAQLPKSWDWRDRIGGRDSIVTPVRAQLNCGSCYAFASAAAVESRIRLTTGGFHKPILSPQDIVDCNPYSQGCDGGFPYLTAGKYTEAEGMVEESCNPYKGVETGQCTTRVGCKRTYTTNYKYIGGYYGACNEILMMLELVHKGPFPVGFEVYPDFKHYKGGVYEATNITDHTNKYEPFEITNHAVLLVGYGYDSLKEKPYWIIKNSWNPNWGENGFFRIVRGKDNCGIESMGLSVDVVV